MKGGTVELVRRCEAGDSMRWSRQGGVPCGMGNGHLRAKAGPGCSSVVELVLRMCASLDFISSTNNTQKLVVLHMKSNKCNDRRSSFILSEFSIQSTTHTCLLRVGVFWHLRKGINFISQCDAEQEHMCGMAIQPIKCALESTQYHML